MEGNNYPDLKKICRLCLEETNDLIKIFESELSIPLRIMACTTLEVKDHDNLPSNICNICRIQLERFYLFRKKCQRIDMKLRKHIKQINLGKISKVFCKREDDDEEDDDEDCLNSQKFIEAYEEKEKNQFQQKNMKVLFHKTTQTDMENTENTFTLLNCKSKQSKHYKLPNNCNISIESEIKIDKQLHQETERKNDKIIYIIEKEFSDEDSEEKETVEVYVDEENESLYLKNDVCESESKENDENGDYNDLIEDDYTMEDEQEASNMYALLPVDNENQITLSNDQEHDSTEQEVEQDVPDKNKSFENKDVKLFKCHLCPQSFSRMFLLDKHLTLHNKNKSYVCNVCRKHFAAKSSLDRHTRIHNGEKPYKCDVCGKAFIQNEILKRHRYLHFDKKPFTCSHCNQAFIQKNLLQHHITIKHSNKPIPKLFSCDICPKAFVHSSGLSRHLILHSGIKYSCEYCKKNFSDKSTLKRHTEAHFRTKL